MAGGPQQRHEQEGTDRRGISKELRGTSQRFRALTIVHKPEAQQGNLLPKQHTALWCELI